MMALAIWRVATTTLKQFPVRLALLFAVGVASVAAPALYWQGTGNWQLTSPARAAEQRVIIIDGDTVDIDGERIRVFNIDAPETRGARCEQELILGLRAKERIAQVLRSGAIRIDRCEASGRCIDRYGRTLARLSTAAGDVGQILISEGLALPWRPGPQAREQRVAVWCPR